MRSNAITLLKLLIENKTEEAILLLKQEIASSVSGNVDTYKARLAFSKYVAKELKEQRPTLAGAYKLNSKQVICSGYAIGVYNDILDGMIEAIATDTPLDYTKILQVDGVKEKLSIDIVKLKTQTKTSRAERALPLIKADDKTYFDSKLTLMLLSTFEKPIVYLDKKRLYIKADNGEGMICNFNINVYDEKKSLKYL